MSTPKFNVVIPYQYYNLILVFVTILALLWGMVAIKRVYRMLRIRSAVLSDRLIQIRGLGSYLTYFDGATRSHMDAVVHTRQSMPPVAMEQLNVASVVKEIDVVSDDNGHYSIGLNMVSTCSSRVIVLFDYNVRNFQQLMVQTRSDLNGGDASDSKLFGMITGLRSTMLGSNAALYPRFQRSEVCSFECLSEEVSSGVQRVTIPLPSTLVSFVQDKIVQPATADAASKLIIGVMVLPLAAGKTHSSRSKSNGHRKLSNRVGAVDVGDLESDLALTAQDVEVDAASEDGSVRTISDAGGPEGYASGRNPLTNGRRGGGQASSPTAKGYVNADTSEKDFEEARPVQSVFASIFVHNVSLPNLRSNANSSTGAVTAPSELIVLDRNLNAYNSLEIFGLASSHPQSSPAAATSAVAQSRPAEGTSSSGGGGAAAAAGPTTPSSAAPTPSPVESVAAAVCSGGCFAAEDCVVCLTDPKQVLLLPCR